MINALDQLQTQLSQLEEQIQETNSLLNDPELSTMAQSDLVQLTDQKKALTESITALSGQFEPKTSDNPPLSYGQANAILEIRGGAGGEEAKLFADDLMRMYLRFAETKRFRADPLDEGVVKFKGRGAYDTFKYESGVHRVQRVPVTEASGRIHTSTASVAVLPEIPPSAIAVREEDLEWKFTRAGGHGGQNVNKVNTAVMLTHIPSGLVIHCRQERYQQQNKEIALELLRSQLWELGEEKRLAALDSSRKLAVGRAMRAEKIRTYNYPENRVTDHRIPKTWKNLDRIIEGDLNPIIEALRLYEPGSKVAPEPGS